MCSLPYGRSWLDDDMQLNSTPSGTPWTSRRLKMPEGLSKTVYTGSRKHGILVCTNSLSAFNWLTCHSSDWTTALPKMHDAESGLDPPPDAEPYCHDVRCEHGAIQPKASLRRAISRGVSPADLLYMQRDLIGS